MIETFKNYHEFLPNSYIKINNKKWSINDFYCIFYEDNFATFQHKIKKYMIVIKRVDIQSALLINEYNKICFIYD